MPVNIGSAVSSAVGGGKPATSGGGWTDIIPLILDAGGSLAGGYLAGKGGEEAAKAQGDAAQQVAALQRQVYYDTRALARPGYMTGGAATNLLGAQFGIAPQDYTTAYAGGGVPTANGGAGPENNWGAGQPVAGHSGGGGANALTGAAGSAIGTVFGGPIGGAIGGAVGGLIRNGGDSWKTLATGAPQGFDYDAYYNADAGLAKEWAKADVRSLFNGNRDAYLYWHAQGGDGAWDKGALNPLEGYEVGGNGLPTQKAQAGAGGAGTGNALADPMAGFMSSPYGKIATSGFRGVDVPEINGAYARGGKVLSGAQSIALDERGKARLGGAYTDYTNGLRSLADQNQVASSQTGSAASAYGSNGGNAMLAAGEAKANALGSAYKGLTQGVSGAVNALGEFGQKNWGWS